MSARFATTQWSQVLAARDGSDTRARDALASLCETYWYPLFAYVRGKGHEPEAAADLIQGFLATLLEKDYLSSVDPDAGRFRSFLLASLRHHLSHERERLRALKRGGGIPTLSLDVRDAEGRYRLEPTDTLTPEQVFERRWAMTILGRALKRLKQASGEDGSDQRYELLKPYLVGEEPRRPYRETAARLGMTEVALRSAVHRLRKRFATTLRQEIAETVADESELDEEVRYLLTVISPLEPP